MALRHAILAEENIRMPEDAFTFEGFHRWVESGDFPETGRIDYLAGDVEIDMSPEDLYTHGVVKTAMVIKIGALLEEEELGDLFSDRTRIRSRFADLSVEPDIVVVLDHSLDAGTVRLVPASARKGPDRYSGLEGADLVVEIVSDSSVKKDLERLPPLYAAAGVPELWLVDARGEDLRFEIHELQGGRYVSGTANAEGWIRSHLLGHSFRLTRRRRPRAGTWRYKLEHRSV